MIALFSPCYLEGKDPVGNDRFQRNLRYLKYYDALREDLDFDYFYLADNASPPKLVQNLLQMAFPDLATISQTVPGASIVTNSKLQFYRWDEHLPRGPGENEYPYCWRSLYHIRELIELGFTKIITIDSDGFVLTRRMAKFIREQDSGWQSFWCEHWKMPEGSVHVLCENAFHVFMEYTSKPWIERVGEKMETSLPFTKLNRQFSCDRHGEIGAPAQPRGYDYYGQAPLGVALEYGRDG